MKIAVLTKEGNILLPQETIAKLKGKNSFIVIEDEESILLKPIKKVDILSLPEKVNDKNAMSLEEISDEVHRYRSEKKRK
jgi:bifunctional DNA-binding transcriptional regulator/antitoxin component of YhaV-PrlF toxin-antitoxin module